MTLEVLLSVAAESVWERARARPDRAAAVALREHLLFEYVPGLPEHELFTIPKVVRQIAYLDPGEGEGCVRHLHLHLRAMYDANKQVEVYCGQTVSGEGLVDLVAAEASVGSRARALGTADQAPRDCQRQRVLQLPVASEERLREEVVYLLAEALVDPVHAIKVAQAWWGDSGATRDLQVLDELLIRLWQGASEEAIAWLETEQGRGPLKVSGKVPLFLFSRVLKSGDRSAAQVGPRLLRVLPRFGAVCFFAAVLRFRTNRDELPEDAVVGIREVAKEQMERLAPVAPAPWVAAARQALN